VSDVLARFSLAGKVAIVTGAARGLGLEAARALASVGAEVVITSRDETTAVAAAREIVTTTRVLGLAVDVRVPESVKQLFARTVDVFGRVDVLVNNAGVTHRGPLPALSEAQWDEVVDTNLKGAWLCSQAAHPIMRVAGGGRIVNVASMFAHVGLPNRAPYIASKGGLAALTRALAIELAADGIAVNAICPGPFLTEMHDPAARGDLVQHIPLGRYGDPAELGPAIVFLASSAASFMTGALLTIDGGYTAR
jgi:NAD(P)-dependent dehydrogenase (short-subunit alcohol dehydrogenase family)